MMTLLRVARLHNAVASAGGMRRGLWLARAYAAGRHAFDAPLHAQPLHRATLGRLAVHAEAAHALAVHGFTLLGRVEVDGDDDAAAELRLAATLAKLTTGRLAVSSASEYLECFGGAGYIEDTGVPRLLRDAQVLPIWEGTTNVLSLDVPRAIARDQAHRPLLARLDAAVRTARAAGGRWLAPTADTLSAARDRIATLADTILVDPAARGVQSAARRTALLMGESLAAALLIEQAAHQGGRAAAVAALWTSDRLGGDLDLDTLTDRHFDALLDGAPLAG
jgi:acyl-CoA dehydrogenase